MEREVVDPGEGTAIPKEGVGKAVDGRIQMEHAPIVADSLLGENALDQEPAASGQEGIDVVVVADPHQGVAPVGQADAARSFRQVDRVAVAVGELEVGFEHEVAIRTWLHADGSAELLAQSPLEVVRTDGHGRDSDDRTRRGFQRIYGLALGWAITDSDMPIADSAMPITDSDMPIADSGACRSPWSERVVLPPLRSA